MFLLSSHLLEFFISWRTLYVLLTYLYIYVKHYWCLNKQFYVSCKLFIKTVITILCNICTGSKTVFYLLYLHLPRSIITCITAHIPIIYLESPKFYCFSFGISYFNTWYSAIIPHYASTLFKKEAIWNVFWQVAKIKVSNVEWKWISHVYLR